MGGMGANGGRPRRPLIAISELAYLEPGELTPADFDRFMPRDERLWADPTP